MSEARDLNDSPSPERRPSEIEDLLRSLVPVPLGVDRDALFFAAGMTAAHRRRADRFFWPAIAASLLVACGGLAVALQNKSTALDAALAASAARPSVERGVANDRPPVPRKPGAELVANDSPAAAADRRAGFGSLRGIDELFWREPSRGSRLTALGWVEGPTSGPGPVGPGQDEPPAERVVPPLRQIRRGDSLELLRELGG